MPRGDDLLVATAVGTGLFDWGDRDGVGQAGQLQHPLGLAADEATWIVADTFNHRVRRYDPRDGRLTTLAGRGPDSPTGRPARRASTSRPP